MLARLETLEMTRAYTAAYRVVDIDAVPVMPLFAAAVPRLFRVGNDARSVVFHMRFSSFPHRWVTGCLQASDPVL